MLLAHGATAVRACAGGECQAVKQQPRVAAPGANEQHPSRRVLLAGAGAALLLNRIVPPALAATAAPAPQRAAAVPTAPAKGAAPVPPPARAAPARVAPPPARAAPPQPPPAKAGPPMNGPPQSILALGYAAIAGLGILFVSTRGKGSESDEFVTAFPVDTPSPLVSILSPPSSADEASGMAAADKWRADAAKEYERRALAAKKRKLESEWFAAYNEKLRNDVALRSQVSRSAANQVERNKAVSKKISSEAQDQDVAPSKKRGVLSALGALLPFRKK